MAAYDKDLHAWTKEQADALRRRAANEIDWDNVAEEIFSLGTSQRKEIRSRLKIALIHLLKWRWQPDHQCPSWYASIRDARGELADLIEENPSLKAYPGEALSGAYLSALNDRAINYLDSTDVPKECPWTIDEILNPDFLP